MELKGEKTTAAGRLPKHEAVFTYAQVENMLASEGEAVTESKGCANCKIETACIVAYLKGAPPCQTTRPTPEAKDWKPGQTVTIKPTRIEHFSMPPKTGTAPKECAHDYLPTGNILLSDPPQDEYRCSKCGAIKGVRLGTAPKEGQ